MSEEAEALNIYADIAETEPQAFRDADIPGFVRPARLAAEALEQVKADLQQQQREKLEGGLTIVARAINTLRSDIKSSQLEIIVRTVKAALDEIKNDERLAAGLKSKPGKRPIEAMQRAGSRFNPADDGPGNKTGWDYQLKRLVGDYVANDTDIENLRAENGAATIAALQSERDNASSKAKATTDGAESLCRQLRALEEERSNYKAASVIAREDLEATKKEYENKTKEQRDLSRLEETKMPEDYRRDIADFVRKHVA
ncbi:hypothetical protein CT0861_01335 [Colletotrichum tofieldiae]|uniref:Uncharacterized protein n=1 Tax=Colletotrichum tofieldiae TaxID=708197 RepID=A0A166TU30_9PEZI|nr:hypothetical protein CT0861_01335 [Colletotrichum tofieldiae]